MGDSLAGVKSHVRRQLLNQGFVTSQTIKLTLNRLFDIFQLHASNYVNMHFKHETERWARVNKHTCGITDSLDLKSCRPSSAISIPSILIVPFDSASLRRADNREDFPAPVRPTMPTYNNNNL